MADDEKVILTAEQAKDMLADGDTVHNFANPNHGLLIGIDYEREDAIKELDKAAKIELDGPGCMAMKHPIVCHDRDGSYTFFEANMEKVAAFETARETAS